MPCEQQKNRGFGWPARPTGFEQTQRKSQTSSHLARPRPPEYGDPLLFPLLGRLRLRDNLLTSQAQYLWMKLDMALRTRRAYQRDIGAAILNPDDHSEGNPIPGFTGVLFGLKVSQEDGSFRPYMKRINFLNCASIILFPDCRLHTGGWAHGQGAVDLPRRLNWPHRRRNRDLGFPLPEHRPKSRSEARKQDRSRQGPISRRSRGAIRLPGVTRLRPRCQVPSENYLAG